MPVLRKLKCFEATNDCKHNMLLRRHEEFINQGAMQKKIGIAACYVMTLTMTLRCIWANQRGYGNQERDEKPMGRRESCNRITKRIKMMQTRTIKTSQFL